MFFWQLVRNAAEVLQMRSFPSTVLMLAAVALSLQTAAPHSLGIRASDPQLHSAQPLQAQSSVPPSANGLDIQLGLAGVWKLGHPCPIRVTVPPEFSSATHLEVVSVDGDGVEVAYRKAIVDGIGSLNVRIGREREELTVRLLADDVNLLETTCDPTALAESLDASQPLVVALGSTMGIEKLALQAPSGTTNLSTTVIESSQQLPIDAAGLASCDLLLISTSDLELLSQISEQQWQAIQEWIGSGGGCIISIASHGDTSASVLPLGRLIPGRAVGVGTILNPGPLESLVVTDEPLQPFPATILELDAVRIDLPLTDSRSQRLPWWTTYAFGHGTIRLIATDLDHPSLANWKDRRLLWERLIEPYFSRAMIEAPEKEADLSQASSYLGYSDLVGQLRATLDQFASVRVVSFGQISAMLVLTLLLVGPVDYFVSVKWLKRPQFSWIFSGVTLIAISIGLVGYYRSIRPASVLVNSAEIIDVDLVTNSIRGDLWFNIYSGEAQQFDVSATTVANRPVTLDWQGLPGAGLGGLSSQLTIDRGMPAYSIEVLDEGGSQFESLGVPSGGTKSVVGHWMTELQASELAINSPAVDLRELSGVDQLQGSFTNPLRLDLRNATLFYHDWYYILNNRITAGERVVISAEQIPKDASRRLNRQVNVDGSVRITRWDPADRNNLDGLLELMMFYKASSGVNYASLAHRFQGRVDHSNLLQLDRAVLIGQIDSSPVDIRIHRSSDDVESNAASNASEPKSYDRELNRVWCRIVFPVQGKR